MTRLPLLILVGVALLLVACSGGPATVESPTTAEQGAPTTTEAASMPTLPAATQAATQIIIGLDSALAVMHHNGA